MSLCSPRLARCINFPFPRRMRLIVTPTEAMTVRKDGKIVEVMQGMKSYTVGFRVFKKKDPYEL